MILSEIFEKDVQRPIEGVIKADDSQHLGMEVDEYVLTNEGAKELEGLLEDYTSNKRSNGVWISGYFGSGKSHMLKMLAHLLGDVDGQQFPREKVSQSFQSKAAGAILPALLSKAERVPSTSLLFNIAQKASVISKDQTDALLKVFVKVFDEFRGYFGTQGHVARFEHSLDQSGQYEDFKIAYERLTQKSWVDDRKNYIIQGRNIDRAYAEVAGGDAPNNLLKTFSDQYNVSIDDFVDEVVAWLDTQPKGTRLNFFVDEVGQFIADDTRQMLDLQTIAEVLDIKSNRRSWVFVTSQEDMDSIIGDQTKQQGQDFSKIQGRFATRVKLTSQDVAEVIRKRLLAKNEKGAHALEQLYSEQAANFKTLFGFVDGARTYVNYDSEDLFVGTYPFVTYQFELFQQGLVGLSEHNAFEGRNKSVGERSMLGVVQEVAKHLGPIEVGSLATFDALFEGIRSSLKGAPQAQVYLAEKNLGNPIAVRVLKALFLVKYVTGFPATVRNLSVLVYDRFGADIPALQAEVRDALAVLEQHTYVQRTGDAYSYLTNEEQDIEKEIKGVEIDSSEVSDKLFALLHANVMKNAAKWRYAKTNQDLPLGYLLDDVAKGHSRDLALHFISPANQNEIENIKLQGAGKAELRVVLDGAKDNRLLPDLALLLKTTKYVKQKQGTALTDSVKRILDQKSQETAGREKELIERVREAVGRSILVHDTVEISSASSTADSRIADGMNVLIAKTYPQLDLLGGKSFAESEIGKFTQLDQGELVGTGGQLEEPSDEVYKLGVVAKDNLAEQVTVKKVIDQFQSKPYGWDLGSILCVIGYLTGQNRITIELDNATLKRTEIAGYLRNSGKHASLIIRKQATFDQSKVRVFSDFLKEFFDESSMPKDAIEVAQYGAERLKTKLEQLQGMVATSRYTFTSELQKPIDLLVAVVGKAPTWYLTEFTSGDELIDVKNDVLLPIEQFINGPQAKTYDDAQKFLTQSKGNLVYLQDESVLAAEALLADPAIFRGNKAHQLKALTDKLRTKLDELVSNERSVAIAKILASGSDLEKTEYFAVAPSDAQQQAIGEIDLQVSLVEQQSGIAELRLAPTTFSSEIFPRLLQQLAAAKPTTTFPRPDGEEEDEFDPKQPSVKPAPQFIHLNEVAVVSSKKVLETTNDVDEHLASLRTALIAEIETGKRILA
ncbi:BREX system P-loop protein BrxC [Salinibacterium amurskyense]|uniref:BREX system P-loop protein BrxC n=1 Tax=Salinibacterium amurskyense TaxID=205941 RepID=UPI00311E5F9B